MTMLAKHSRSAAEGSNRLTSVSGKDVISFTYNGLGDRYQQIVNSTTTTYQLDLALLQSASRTGLVNVLADGENTYLYGRVSTPAGRNTVVAQISDTQTGYYLPDVLGSVRQLTSLTGEVQLSQRFTPFGEVKEKYGDAEDAFGYAGQMYDEQIGLLYLRARYYAPGTGRFISHDTWSGDRLNR
ncbi:MAG: RHS repeat-associated core domain-containing protein [Anaerolineaceae bacterium]|nr:RHS repeat-associated core domain-containing protein [Anaerolineaceae bacterium]